MLFFTASLLRSSPPDPPFFFKLLFRVGDCGAFSWLMRFVDDGIFDNLRFGEELRSLSAVLLACGRRSGALDKVGKVGAVATFPAPKMFGWLPAFVSGAVF
jgi:hypothetical protein